MFKLEYYDYFIDDIIKIHSKIIPGESGGIYHPIDINNVVLDITHDKNILFIKMYTNLSGYSIKDEIIKKFESIGNVVKNDLDNSTIYVYLDLRKIYLINSKRKFSYFKIHYYDNQYYIEKNIEEISRMGIPEENRVVDSENNRDNLDKLITYIDKGDSLIINDIENAFGSTAEIINLIDESYTKEFNLIIENFVFDINIDKEPKDIIDKIKRITELYISKCKSLKIKRAIECSKLLGDDVGRPAIDVFSIPEKFINNYKLFIQGRINMSNLAKLSGVSRPTAYKYKNMLNEYYKNIKS